MTTAQNPDHSSGALALGEATAEAADTVVKKDKTTVKESRPQTSPWLWLGVLLLGLATLATGIIFFSYSPGVLAAEVVGAGLALLATFLWLPGERRRAQSLAAGSPAKEAAIALPTLPTAPTPPAEAAPHVETPPAPPAAEPIPEPPPTLAPADERPAEAAASAEAPPAAPDVKNPAAKQPPRKKTPPPTNGQRAVPPARPKAKPKGKPSGGKPPDARIEDLLISANSEEVQTGDARFLEWLGARSEHIVDAVLTDGAPGGPEATKLISDFYAMMETMPNRDPYPAFASLMESFVALLRAGKPIPPARPLTGDFAGWYEAVRKPIEERQQGR